MRPPTLHPFSRWTHRCDTGHNCWRCVMMTRPVVKGSTEGQGLGLPGGAAAPRTPSPARHHLDASRHHHLRPPTIIFARPPSSSPARRESWRRIIARTMIAPGDYWWHEVGVGARARFLRVRLR